MLPNAVSNLTGEAHSDASIFGYNTIRNITIHDGHSTALSYLYEEPRRNKGQAAVLAIEAVVIRIEREVIQIEEPATSKNHFTNNTVPTSDAIMIPLIKESSEKRRKCYLLPLHVTSRQYE
jgi:hypothetical protein